MSGDGSASVKIVGYSGFERIGSGGFSAVYRATQASMGRDVAVKVLNADLSTERDRRTFERECRALGSLATHPNIVTVHNEAFTADGRPCIVMELYRSNYREQLDRDGPLPAREVIDLGIKMGSALTAAHAAGILHRDIKPHNIFRSVYGEPALGDFGISTVEDERSISGASGLSVAYAAPEVLEDGVIAEAADIYALAATMFHLLEGVAPFAAPQLRTSVRKILTEPPPALARPDVPAGLERVLVKALAKSPGDRHATAADFAADLRRLRDAPQPPPISPSPASGAGSVSRPAERTQSRPTTTTGSIERSASGESQVEPSRLQRESSPASRSPSGLPSEAEGTVVRERAQPSADALVEDVDPGDVPGSRTRRTVAIGIGVAAVVGLGAALAFVGGSGSEEAVTTTTMLVVDSDQDIGDDFFVQVQIPTAIDVRTDDAGFAIVSFDPVDAATRYEVVAVADRALVIREDATDVDRYEIGTGFAASRQPCWTVEAFDDNGAASGASDPTCVAGG